MAGALCGGVDAISGGAKVAVAHDVVALEHRPRLVTRQAHRDPLGNTRAHEVSHGRSPQVVRNPTGHASGSARDLPRFHELANRSRPETFTPAPMASSSACFVVAGVVVALAAT